VRARSPGRALEQSALERIVPARFATRRTKIDSGSPEIQEAVKDPSPCADMM
jgi:hypothetical protein